MFDKLSIKRLLEKIPINVGIKLANIPFKYRLGNSYIEFQNIIQKQSSEKKNKELIFKKFRHIVDYAIKNIPFYNKYYSDCGFSLTMLNSFEDISRVPIINKTILNNYDVNYRSKKEAGLGLFNTGGTTGNPLSFYLEDHFYSREWSHMHSIWKKLGYLQSDVKLTFRGKNIGNKLYQYNYINNEIFINTYKNLDKHDFETIYYLIKKYRIKYLHGYPSALYIFLKNTKEQNKELSTLLQHSIKGVFLGSEYPIAFYRNFIESFLNTPTISWYGHSEGVILASESDQELLYEPYLSYGYSEAVKIQNKYHLVGTSFDNIASPFIRYDTEDVIKPTVEDEILISFSISEGREGEFVQDNSGNLISLTSLIFGRHHEIFSHIDFIQVQQKQKGFLIIYYVSKKILINPQSLFDSSNVEITFKFKQIDKPFFSKSGKILLLVK